MFDTVFIITLFLLASLLVCLFTLRLSINRFFEIPTPSVYFDHPPPRLLNLTRIFEPPLFFGPPVFYAPKSTSSTFVACF